MTLTTLVKEVSTLLLNRHFKLTTAESCTGGGLSFYLTEQPGSSAWFESGLVTYSNEAKMALLGVKESTLQTKGAVSENTAREMAEGALLSKRANISISITGIAGPEGGTAEKPVGTVWFGIASQGGKTETFMFHFKGNRQAVRLASIEQALTKLKEYLK